ncbi:MAG: glycine cleavage system protein GcvH [Candidatus Eisenbacteria bacterium]|nr:glycine cleavage system protein GcvH [Candidatus Eisenbacteria bacterium]
MMHPSNFKYTEQHEWALIEGDIATIGITDYAQKELGDVVFVELPAPGTKVSCMKPFGVIEAVKTVSDIFSPLTGEVLETNEKLKASPQLINESPNKDAWMIKIKIANPAELGKLLPVEKYLELTGEKE